MISRSIFISEDEDRRDRSPYLQSHFQSEINPTIIQYRTRTMEALKKKKAWTFNPLWHYVLIKRPRLSILGCALFFLDYSETRDIHYLILFHRRTAKVIVLNGVHISMITNNFDVNGHYTATNNCQDIETKPVEVTFELPSNVNCTRRCLTAVHISQVMARSLGTISFLTSNNNINLNLQMENLDKRVRYELPLAIFSYLVEYGELGWRHDSIDNIKISAVNARKLQEYWSVYKNITGRSIKKYKTGFDQSTETFDNFHTIISGLVKQIEAKHQLFSTVPFNVMDIIHRYGSFR
eukprot:216192_1